MYVRFPFASRATHYRTSQYCIMHEYDVQHTAYINPIYNPRHERQLMLFRAQAHYALRSDEAGVAASRPVHLQTPFNHPNQPLRRTYDIQHINPRRAPYEYTKVKLKPTRPIIKGAK